MKTLNTHTLSLLGIFCLSMSTMACQMDINTSVDGTIQLQLNDQIGQCDPNESRPRVDPNATGTFYTQGLVNGSQCQVDFDALEAISGTDTVRAKIQTELDKQNLSFDSFDPTINAVSITITNVRLLDGNGAVVNLPRIPAWNVSLSIAGDELLNQGGNDLTAFLSNPVTVRLSPAGVQAAQASIDSGAAILAEALGQVRLDLQDLVNMPNVNNPVLEFKVKVTIDATGTINPFDLL